MIHHLNGRMVEKTPTYAVIECGGVGYQVHISLTTFERIGSEEHVLLHTHLVVREDAQLLYGFSHPEERELFLLLNVHNNVRQDALIAQCGEGN